MSCYVLDVTLAHIRPKIWRQIRVPGDLSLGGLHEVLQIAFGWNEAHLHEFVVGGQRFGLPDPEEPDEALLDEEDATVASALPRKSSTARYVYDLGDNWIHNIAVHRIEDAAPARRLHSLAARGLAAPIACLAGKRCAPPEDCGGPSGYAHFLAAITSPEHPDHDDLLAWVGGAFDAEAFSLRDVNEELQALL